MKNNDKATTISRHEYASLFGPTVGDKIQLADTYLYIEVEQGLRVYGDEAVYGGGKTLRDGMGYDNQLTSVAGALDLVITNVVVVDPLLGVLKADVGIEDGRIVEAAHQQQVVTDSDSLRHFVRTATRQARHQTASRSPRRAHRAVCRRHVALPAAQSALHPDSAPADRARRRPRLGSRQH